MARLQPISLIFLWSAALQFFPRTHGQFPKHPVPWWKVDSMNSVREKRYAFSRVLRHHGDPQFLEAFRQERARAQLTLKEAQRISWMAYLSSITNRTKLTEVFNRVCKISGKFSPLLPPFLSLDREAVMDPKTVANLFAENFASVSRKDSDVTGTRHRQELESFGAKFASMEGNPIKSHFFSL